MRLFLLSFFAVGFAHAADIPYKDADFGCISETDAARYVADFKIDEKSFGGHELCKDEVDTKKLFNDLAIIEKGEFDTDSQNKFVRGFVDLKNYYGWMKGETRGVARGQDIPYATAYNSGGYFTMQDGWAKLSTLGRVGTIVHEARHTAGYRHIRCTQGPYQGSTVDGCDTTYNYGGSHAIEMEYYARVAVQGKNFHPVYKKMARLMAIARSNIFFNTPVIKAREALLALNADRTAAKLYDNGTWIDREIPKVAGRLKRTSFGGVLFDGLNAMAVELYKNSGFADAVKDTYSYFKLLNEKTGPVRDFEEFDSGIKRYAVKIGSSNTLASYSFPNGAWGADVQLPFEVAFLSTAIPGSAQKGLYLVGQNGELATYTPETQRLTAVPGKWDAQVSESVVFQTKNLVLRNNGQIFVQSAAGMTPWEEAPGTYSGLITTPVYDGFEVNKE